MSITNAITPPAWTLMSAAMADSTYVDGLHLDRETQTEWIDGADLHRAAQRVVDQVEGLDDDERRDLLSDVSDCLRNEMRARRIEVRDD